MYLLYSCTATGHGTSFEVPSFCFRETDDNGAAGLQLLDNNLTGCHFAFSCQTVATTGPFLLLYCHCFDSPGFNFSLGMGGSPLFDFLFDICGGKYFKIDFPSPTVFLVILHC